MNLRNKYAGWLFELGLEQNGIRAKETGQLVEWNLGNANAALRGLIVHLLVQVLGVFSRLLPGRPYTVAFTPKNPSPWYLIWAVVRAGNGRITSNLRTADILFYFEDKTRSKADGAPSNIAGANSGTRTINANCTDISKAKVAEVFEQVFGYSLSVDPVTWQGLAVEKSDKNGAHDGRVVQCPTTPLPGKVYQRLLLNSDNGASVLDYRSPTINGEIPLVFIKERPMNSRFANYNTRVSLADPRSLFTPEELQSLRIFCQHMGLEFGGLDVLRNRGDGRIYVVDVNKTDMGPPTGLGFIAQIRAIRILAKAFRNFIVLDRSRV